MFKESVTILHVFDSQPPFKAESSTLGIYFVRFAYYLFPFSDFGAFSVWQSWTLIFHVLWFIYCQNRLKLSYSLSNTIFVWF